MCATVPRAARLLGLHPSTLGDDIQRGKLHLTARFGRVGYRLVSYQELREYAKTRGLDIWHIPDTAEFAYVGRSFRPRAKRNVAVWEDSVTLLLKKYPGFDGSLFVAPGALPSLSEDELEFVCRNLFAYNQTILRYRPLAVQRHVYLCCNRKTGKRADQLCAEFNGRYPGVIQTIPITHLHRVQAFKENTNG